MLALEAEPEKKLDVVFPITAFLEKHNTVESIFGLSSEKCH